MNTYIAITIAIGVIVSGATGYLVKSASTATVVCAPQVPVGRSIPPGDEIPTTGHDLKLPYLK